MRLINLPPDPQFGVESIIIVAIKWAKYIIINGNIIDTSTIDTSILGWKYYATKAYSDIEGKILDIDNIESVLNLDANQSSVSINVTLDDVDDKLLDIINVADTHKAEVHIFQSFEGLTIEQMFPIFQGEINSNFIWSDENKTLKFTVVSKIEDIEVGFSPEEGDIVDLPEEMVGQPWPMAFGTIIKQKALQITQLPTGITQSPLAIGDKSLVDELTRVEGRTEDWRAVANVYFLAALEAAFSGLTDLQHQMEDAGSQALAAAQKNEDYTNHLTDIQGQQHEYENANAACKLIGNYPFPIRGHFDIGGTDVEARVEKSNDIGLSRIRILSMYNAAAESTGISDLGTPPDQAKFVYIQAGSEVKCKGPYPLRYVVNILGSQIVNVFAYRKYENLRKLTQVPPKHWKEITISCRSFHGGSFSVTGIQLNNALTNIDGENWDSDDLYVTYNSLGGNTFYAVIIEAITRYTHYSIDPDSLHKIPNFPINGVIFEKQNVLQFLQEFCWQNKVAIWLTEGTFKFQYLVNLGEFGGVLHLKDIISDSLQITFSPTENLATKLTGTWHFDFSVEKDNRIVIRNNIERYGMIERTYRVWAFNSPEAVQSTLSFWTWRYSNTWKRLKFKLPITWLKLETFDVIAIDQDVVNLYKLSTDRFMWASVLDAFYNTKDNLIEVEVELPYKLGDLHEDDGYWPIFSFNLGLYNAQRYDRNYSAPTFWNGSSAVQQGFRSVQTVSGQDVSGIYDGGEGGIPERVSLALPSPDPITGRPQIPGHRAVSDMGGELGTFMSRSVDLTGDVMKVETKDAPSWKYTYGDIALGSPPTGDAGGGSAVPGTVGKQTGEKTYACTLYPNGLKGKAVKGTGILLQKADPVKDPIPEGTWAIFAKVSRTETKDGETTKIEEYYFQVAIWM